MNDNGQADHITMSGGGRYSLATIGAKDVIDAATPMVEAAIRAMAVSRQQEFTLTDMGCADGGTSLDMIRRALATIRSLDAEVPVRIVYADQPRNDYNALIQIVHGLSDFASWINEFEAVFPFVAGTSFYHQIVPDNSLDLGFSATAMHWLSRKPGDIDGHVHMVGATGADLAAFERQARADWLTILSHRAKELRSGGRLVLVNFGKDEKGRYLGATDGVNMFDTFNSIWREFLEDGSISEDEYRGMTLPQYYRTVEEFAAPFAAGQEAAKLGLRLEHIETRVVGCPFAKSFSDHGDSARFAREYIPTIRTWNESVFFGALSASRPLKERGALVDRYYDRYRNIVENDPAGHAMDYVHAYLSISKD